ncbi:NucA/NucB deoxyribonuclease domain-containing protein [Streptomyces beihaiensis]|uniref:NucA/NucB deoxyribonuclease domain-containing protein n=1 Tax=Streptomyces beihaiensis TaxID=2984495 RepID=A0ABT3TVS8_9ACTN|nr:NucA/NucB deoxyribonuclease domain-containing protein [Streptomyces beihaiensis]MCX3061162.1 NucA/NucB deoxyribonuclease domain-containing protein [Streptomyces beihaiensis]
MHIRTALTRLVRGAVLTTAFIGLSAPNTVAAADGSAASSGSGGFVPAASVPADQLRHLDRPVPLNQYSHHSAGFRSSRAAAAPAANDEADLRKECARHAKEARSAKGWLKSRFESCQKRPYDLVLRNKKGTESIGRLWFDMWTLGFTYDGSRRVDYVASIENIRVQTVPSEDATKWRIGQRFSYSIDGSSSDPDAKVIAPKVQGRDELLGLWDRKPHWNLTYTSPDKGAQYSKGNQQLVSTLVTMDLTADSPNASSYSQVGAYYSNVRFDYAGPVAGKYKGTVFTQAHVVLTMDRKDPAVRESALHIYDALHRPERTFPSFVGKSVPGEKEPLHRLVNKDKQDANRKKSIAECEKVWGKYDGTDLQCDEYPFASTKEGSTKGDDRYSVRLIDGDDNEAGGRRLNDVYINNRVLDGDPFYVKVT